VLLSLLPSLPRAACRYDQSESPPETFYGPHVCDEGCDQAGGCIEGKSEQGRFARIQEAKRICASCPERLPCLQWAIDTDQAFGVWGGMTERERRKMKRGQRGD
jgi:hypothetical protein